MFYSVFDFILGILRKTRLNDMDEGGKFITYVWVEKTARTSTAKLIEQLAISFQKVNDENKG